MGLRARQLGRRGLDRVRHWRRSRIIVWTLVVAQCLGFVSSINALMSTRTPQGTIAWIVSLNTMPVLAVPAYWVFGRNRFNGYVRARENVENLFDDEAQTAIAEAARFVADVGSSGPALAGQNLAELPYLGGNAVELLVDGEATFADMLAGIAEARDYILFQFYIVRADDLGRRVADALVERAGAGVDVWFLYDEIGSQGLPRAYLRRLEEAGVRVSAFQSTRGRGNRFQLNFRNHRKIVVVDGSVGWVGGHNVGDEYLGLDPDFPNWRDTHVRVEGPAVLELQLSFVEDWWWAQEEAIGVSWRARPSADGDAVVLILPTGPADRLETASLMYQQAIHAAQNRIWISSPYFVPDHGVLSAMHLAEKRGVDVRVIIPDVPDSRLVYYSTWAFVDELIDSGVEIHRYLPGFNHQKVFLVDDRLGGVGTANLDNRSFRLNFEVTALIQDSDFVTDVERMFEADFARSRLMTAEEVAARPLWFRLLARASYLTAPIQ
ncbi:MAG: cardiolipin synthase [Gemmatimonadales bacterium]